MRDFYKVLLVGASGKGKTYTAETMDPNTTGFINVENKPLSFPNKFKYMAKCTNSSEAMNALIEYAKNPEIKSIFFDSFSAYMDYVLKEAMATRKGFDIWSQYNGEIAKFHEILNLIQKEVFVTGHYEILDIEGAPEKRLKVYGKQNEGLVERHYTMVLYADSKYVDEKPEYFLQLHGMNISAKCPPKMFGDASRIPNDGKYILEQIEKFTA